MTMDESDKHLRLSSQKAAEASAIKLFTLASAIYPADNESLIDHCTQEILDATLLLSMNARRFMELSKRSDQEISSMRWNYELDVNKKLESSFKRSMNAIIHSQKAKVHFCQSPTDIFSDSRRGDCVALHIVTETDRYPEVYIDLFGFAWTFLSKVNHKVL